MRGHDWEHTGIMIQAKVLGQLEHGTNDKLAQQTRAPHRRQTLIIPGVPPRNARTIRCMRAASVRADAGQQPPETAQQPLQTAQQPREAAQLGWDPQSGGSAGGATGNFGRRSALASLAAAGEQCCRAHCSLFYQTVGIPADPSSHHSRAPVPVMHRRCSMDWPARDSRCCCAA